jgi:hypothetical protein
VRFPVLPVIGHEQDFLAVRDFEQPARLLADRAESDAAQLGLVPDVVFRELLFADGGIAATGFLRPAGANGHQ